MSEKGMTEWQKRFDVLQTIGTIFESTTFDNNGLCTNLGSYLRCDLGAIYFDLRTESGEGEALWDDETAYAVFEPTLLEKVAFDLVTTHKVYYLSYRKSGQVFGKQIDEEAYEDLHNKCHSDDPDEEMKKFTDGEISF